ncbi:hypothetical protein CVT24_012796 [Panaeolus cyanescens]|uniref:HMG box domain-containing protein n=1 Tax=Panaeolus cyanescens TaxID=181874 RepID=A0A409W2M7_9AGAR|nr:hypothetical protein CVT24_012796 [Panaeolus cyanescens]
MPLLSRIFGWLPPDNEDFVDVQILPPESLLPFENPTFHISNINPIKRSPMESNGNFESTSPASSTSALSVEAEPPLERRENSNSGKHHDPSWVARPRNEFILFRCDYVRKHSREGKRVRRPPGAEAEKTLSKQAAEAWHHLSPEERLYWKERANGERNEHARKYPDYRYRPKKSQGGRRRNTRSSPVKPTVSAVVKEEPPSVDTVTTTRSTSTSGSASPSLAPSLKAGQKPLPKAARRSISVPEFANVDQSTRRLRSTASQGWLAVSSQSPADRLSLTSSRRFTSMSQLTDHSPFDSTSYQSQVPSASTTPQPAPPVVRSTSSSLLNWNGERMVPAAPQPTQFVSSTSVTLSSISAGLDSGGNPLLSDFTSGGNPIAPSQLFNPVGNGTHYLPNGDIWMSQIHSYPSENNTGSHTQGDSGAVDVLGDPSTTATNPEASSQLFMMDAEEFFNPHF